MSKTSWRKLINPDYLGAYSLEDNNGNYIELTLTIKSVQSEEVKGPEGKEQCPVLRFVENSKPMVLNSTNAKTIEKLYKSRYIEDWVNCRIILCVEKIKAFGEYMDALRIKNKIPEMPKQAVKEYKCADCSRQIQGMGDHDAQYIASKTNQKYGKPLCSECATKRAEAEKAEKVADPLATPVETETTEGVDFL